MIKQLEVVQTPEVKHTFKKEVLTHKYQCFNSSPDGKYIVYGYQTSVYIYELERKILIGQMAGHKLKIQDVEYSPDGGYIKSQDSKEVRVFNSRTCELVLNFRTKYVPVFSPNSEQIASIHKSAIKIRCLKKGVQISEIKIQGVLSLKYSSNADQLIFGLSNSINAWNLDQNRQTKKIVIQSALMVNIEQIENGKLIIYSDEVQYIYFFCTQSKKKLRKYCSPRENQLNVLTTAISPTEEYKILIQFITQVILWDLRSSKDRIIYTSFIQYNDAQFSADGQRLLYSNDGPKGRYLVMQELNCINQNKLD